MLDFTRFKVLTFDCYGTMIDWETGIFSCTAPNPRRSQKINCRTPNFCSCTPNSKPPPSKENFCVIEMSCSPWYAASVRVWALRQPLPKFALFRSRWRTGSRSLTQWKPCASSRSRYQLAVISNVDDDLFAATAPKLEVAFDHVITAQQAGCYKPCMKIFKLAEERMGVTRDQWLHVGQSIYHDVIPAQSLGIATVWVNRPSPRPGAGAAKAAAGKPDLEVPDLKTLADLATTENREP